MSDKGAPPQPAADSSWIPDVTRTVVGGLLIAGSLILVGVCLSMAIGYAESQSAKDATKDATQIVAILGAITTFVGSTIGLFFGIHASDKATNIAGQAAAAANQNAMTANNTANAAASTVDKANATAQAAVNTAQAATANPGWAPSPSASQANLQSRLFAKLRTVQSAHSKAFKGLADMHALVAPANAAAAQNILDAVSPDEDDLTVVDKIVLARLPANANTSLPLIGPPYTTIGLDMGGYQTLCDNCTNDVNARFGKAIMLDGSWRAQHAAGTGDTFIYDLYQLVG